MKRCVLVVVAACTSPAPSSLQPAVHAMPQGDRLFVGVDFEHGDPDIDVGVTFRNRPAHVQHRATGGYLAAIQLDTPVASDETLDVSVDGIAMTMTAPTQYDTFDVPLFVSRSHDATITWSPASADEMGWYVLIASCTSSQGGKVPANATSLTLTANDWTPPPVGTAYPPTCTTTVRVVRDRQTPIDPAFAGGGMMFERFVDLQFASTP